MLWPRNEFHAAYGQIKHDALQSSGTCTILLLVALDVDALCAAEILTRLFQADLMSYSLLAVRGYEDVMEARERRICSATGTCLSNDLRSVILLNCGALVDVAKLLALPRHVKCYVLDSHRPIHLANIYDAYRQIVVFDDGAVAQDEYPACGPELAIEDFEDEAHESDESDDEEATTATRATDVDRETRTEPATRIQATQERRDEILRYYRGSFYGAPAATVAFEVAQQVQKSRIEWLWFAILGLTKQLLLEEIDTDNYNLMVARFQDDLLALNAAGGSRPVDLDDDVRHPGYEHGTITFENEYRFMCYRHWSLYDAMYYSDYVASKLGLYHDHARRVSARNASNSRGHAGETALHVFLARMGFSLCQSQQPFAYMPLEMKQMLRDKTQEMAPEFGLDDLFYGSFQRTVAFQYQLCAADAVYGLQALLEAPESYVATVFEKEVRQQQSVLTGSWNLDSILKSWLHDRGSEATENEAKDARANDFRQQNFMLAHTALACHSVASSKLMESGIKVAMALKQAIVRVGLSIMERKLLVRVKHFRYVCLNVPEREQELFANANVLTQLALFLLNVHRTSGKWGGPKASKRKRVLNEDGDDGDREEEPLDTTKAMVPLVLITRHPAQHCFLIVGLTCPATPGDIHRNTLGTAFKLAAGETGANFRQDGFTSAVVEIQVEEIQSFVEQLHNVLDA